MFREQGCPYLVQSFLPVVLSLHHELDAVGQCGQDPGRRGLKRDGLALKVDPIDPSEAHARRH